MKNAGNKGFKGLMQRYRELPSALRSQKLSERNRAQKLLALTICIPLMLWGLGYIAHWEITRARIERENAAWSALYAPPSESPVPLITAAPLTSAPTSAPTAAPTATPTQTPSAAPTAEITSAPTPTASPVPTPTALPESTLT